MPVVSFCGLASCNQTGSPAEDCPEFVPKTDLKLSGSETLSLHYLYIKRKKERKRERGRERERERKRERAESREQRAERTDKCIEISAAGRQRREGGGEVITF